MALVADTQHAVEMLYGMQSELQQDGGDEELGQELDDMISLMESPLFTQLLTLRESVKQLCDHVESTPRGHSVGEFDFTPNGELILVEPPAPEPPVVRTDPVHPHAYQNEITLDDEMETVRSVAAVQQSAPPAAAAGGGVVVVGAAAVVANDVDSGDEALLDSIVELAMGREVQTIKLLKPDKGGLGFSVVGLKSENHGELGIFVQQIQPNGVADRTRELLESDQILAINGHLLDASVSHQKAIEMLQSAKGLVELVIARGIFEIPASATNKDVEPDQSDDLVLTTEQPPDYDSLEPQPEIEQIELYNDGSGLGFGIVGMYDVGIMVKTILPGGTADKDGRLRSGDIILQIGDTSLQGMTSDQVAVVLRQAGSRVRLTVARESFQTQVAPVESADPPSSADPGPAVQAQLTSDVYSQPPLQFGSEDSGDVEVFDVVLEKGTEGLGITIAGYVRDLATGEVSGIFIRKIAEGSAADKCGRVKVNDQIIEVDGQTVEGFTNVQAVDTLRNTGSVVRIRLARHPPGVLDLSNVNMNQSTETNGPVAITEAQTEEEATPLAPPSYPPPSGIFSEEAEINSHGGELDPNVEAAIIASWQDIMGPDVTIVVAQLSRFREGGGLGISLEGTVDIDESGEEVRPHHYIRSILPDGPVGRNGRLMSGDELVEVNSVRLFGFDHRDVVKILKELPMHVSIVCARHPHPVFPEAEPTTDHVPQPAVGPEEAVVSPAATGGAAADSVEDAAAAAVVVEGAVVSTAVVSGSGGSGDDAPSDSPGGVAIWDDRLQTVELNKGDRGLGFSILDYQDPLNPSQTVIVIRSLVPGGVAEQDGQLIPGDRLVLVNNHNLDNCSLEEAVHILKGIPVGPVALCVTKPLPHAVEEDEETVITPIKLMSIHQPPPPKNRDVSSWQADLAEINELQAALDSGRSSPTSESSYGSTVEEVVARASIATPVQSSMDVALMLTVKPRQPQTAEAPPDPMMTLAVTPQPEVEAAPVAPQPEVEAAPVAPQPEVEAAPVAAVQASVVRSAPPVPERTTPVAPPKPVPPPKPAPRTPPDDTQGTLEVSEASPSLRKDVRALAIPASIHSPILKRTSILLPTSLEKSIVLKKGNAGLGLTVNAEKSNGVIVKSIIRGGAIHHDGRLAVGDFITSVNGKPMRNLTNVEARATLRKASMVGSDISITYIPGGDASAYRDNPAPSDGNPALANVQQSPGESSSSPADNLERFSLPLAPVDPVRVATISLSPVSMFPPAQDWEQIRTVTLTKEPNKNLGISIVGVTNKYGRSVDGQPVQGIYIKHVLDDSRTGRTGALKTGDRILEVNGCDLRDVSHDYAVAIIRNASNPVSFVVQSMSPGANIPTSPVSFIYKAEEREEEEEASFTMVTDEESSELRDINNDNGKQFLQVNTEMGMPPLSPLKHKLSLSGSEEDEDGTGGAALTFEPTPDNYDNLEGEIFVINLVKSPNGLGISLAGNRDRTKMSVYVVGIDPGGAAAQDGRLQVADEIVSINSVSVYGKSHQRASSIIKDVPKEGDIQLIIRRHPRALEQLAVTPIKHSLFDKTKMKQQSDFDQADFLSVPPSLPQAELLNYPNVHAITIRKGTSGLGFAVHEKEDMAGKKGIFVRDITPGGAACEEGSLREDDHILCVDDNLLIDTDKRKAVSQLKATEQRVKLIVSSMRPFVPTQEPPNPHGGGQVDTTKAEIFTAEVSVVQHTPAHRLTNGGSDIIPGRSSDEEEHRSEDGQGSDEYGSETGSGLRDVLEARLETSERELTMLKLEPTYTELDRISPEPEPEPTPPEPEPTHTEPEPTYTEPESDYVELKPMYRKPEPEPLTPEPEQTASSEPVRTTPDLYTCPIVPGVKTDIVIDKGKTGLGLSIVGGSDTQLNIIVVHEVYEKGAALRDNRLWPGDQLIRVNGIDLTNAMHDQAINALRQSPPHIRLTVLRGVHARGPTGDDERAEEEGEEEEGREEEEYEELLSVELKHTRGRNLGVNIVGKTSGRGVVVSMILRGGAAHAEGTMKPGDHILSINGRDVQEATREEVAAMLKATDGHVLFEIGRRKNEPRSNDDEDTAIKDNPVRQVELKKVPGESLGLSIAGGRGSSLGDVPLIIASINPNSQAARMDQLKVLDRIEKINGQSVTGLSYANAIQLLKSAQGVVRLEVSELSQAMKEWYLRRSRQVSSRGDDGMVKASVKSVAASSPEERGSAGRLKKIVLERGPDGLGFSIVGGYGSPHGDLPIYIKTVFDKGAAVVNGQLRRGDQIVAVDGESLEAATHEQAVDVLKRAKGRVVLSVFT